MREDFFDSVCVFDYRGYCKNAGDCLKKHFQEICKNRNCLGESCLKRNPKNSSSSVPLEIVNLLNFVAIIMKEKIPMQ